MAKKFVPMQLPRGAFQPSGNKKGPTVQPTVVVPIRSSVSHREPKPLFDPSEMPRPRTIYPIPEPEPEPTPPPAPPGPTPEEVAQLVREAEERGYGRGKAEMEKLVQERVEQEQRLKVAADAVESARELFRAEARRDVARLVVEAVQHICGNLPAARMALLEKRLAEASEQLVEARRVVLRVAPNDFQLVQGKFQDRPGWKVVADPAVRGGCQVTSENGEIDGTLSAAFRSLNEAAADWQAEVEAARVG